MFFGDIAGCCIPAGGHAAGAGGVERSAQTRSSGGADHAESGVPDYVVSTYVGVVARRTPGGYRSSGSMRDHESMTSPDARRFRMAGAEIELRILRRMTG